MKKPVFCTALAAMLLLTNAGAQTPASSPASSPAASTTIDDRFVAGSSPRVSDRTSGDLFVAGGRVEVSAPVDGDTVLAGGEVKLAGAVARNVYAAGGRLVIDTDLGRHLRAAAGQLELSSKARVAGNVVLAGGELSVHGPIKGSARLMGGKVLIDAPIDGDVNVSAGRVELGPNARLGGALRWRSDSDLQRDPAAQVAGPIERLAMPVPPAAREAARAHSERTRRGTSWLAGAWWTLGLMLVAALLVAALPGTSVRVASTLRERTGMSLLAGFVALVCIPVAVLVLLISVIGVPLALLTLLLYLLLLPLGYLVSAMGLGHWALTRWRAADAGRTAWRIGAVLLALLLLALLGRIPFIGGWVAFAAVLAGLGAIVLQGWPRRAAVSAPTAT